jgi:hypothetical protein
MASSSTAQGSTGQRARAAVDEQEVGIWAWRLEDQALASGPVPSPGDVKTLGSEAELETGQTAG